LGAPTSEAEDLSAARVEHLDTTESTFMME
jgi:hypothetical protein